MGAMNNENAPQVLTVQLGSPGADLTVPAGYFIKKSKILGVYLQNGADIAQSDTNYAILQLLNGSNKVAQFSTKTTGGDGALTANVAQAMNIDPDVGGYDVVAEGTSLKFKYDETDAGTNIALTNALVTIVYFPY